jgi:hypothetical protein
MARTTLDLDPALIEELKHLAASARESMSRTTNRLLRDALRKIREEQPKKKALRWNVVQKGTPAQDFDPANREYLDELDRTP